MTEKEQELKRLAEKARDETGLIPGPVRCRFIAAMTPDVAVALLERVERLEQFASTFADTAEAAVRHHEWKAAGSKGMAVPFHDHFANVPPSVVVDLRWLAARAREALKP